jgi:mono/diheme cytochrome c family protein
MDPRYRHRILTRRLGLAVVLFAGGLLTAPRVPAEPAPAPTGRQADSLPPGVTPAMVTRGRQIFGGAGLCLACHGTDARGGIGPDLTDDKWLHGNGDFAEIVQVIVRGVTSDSSQTGQIMPPRGGSSINDEQVRAVAAYVWTLSRRAKTE